MKQFKSNKGFTLVELIVVIAVLALLAVGAVIAFAGIQANARRSVLSADTRSLVSASNAAIATATGRGVLSVNTVVEVGTGRRILMTVPRGAGLEEEVFYVDFETAAHMTRAISAMTWVVPPNVPGTGGSFLVAAERISTWTAAAADTVIPNGTMADPAALFGNIALRGTVAGGG